MEWKRPEAVYQNAIEKKREGYDALKSSLAALKAELGNLSARMEQNLRKLEGTEKALQIAVTKGDHVNGPLLLEKRNQLRQTVETDKRQHWAISKRVDEGRTKLQDVRNAVEKLETEKKESVAEIRMLQSSRNIESLWNNFYTAPEDVAVKNLRERMECERESDELERGMNVDHIVESTIAAQDFQDLCKRQQGISELPAPGNMTTDCVDAELMPDSVNVRS